MPNAISSPKAPSDRQNHPQAADSASKQPCSRLGFIARRGQDMFVENLLGASKGSQHVKNPSRSPAAAGEPSSLQAFRAKVSEAVGNRDYRRILTGVWTGQLSAGLVHSSYANLLQRTGLKTVSQGFLASQGFSLIETLVLATVVGLHTSYMRDRSNRIMNQQAGVKKEDKKSESVSRAERARLASNVWICEGINIGITLGTLGVVASVSAGTLGGGLLFAALALLQVLRSCNASYQIGFMNALRPLVRDEQRSADEVAKLQRKNGTQGQPASEQEKFFQTRHLLNTESVNMTNQLQAGMGRACLMMAASGLMQLSFAALAPHLVMPAVAGVIAGSTVISLVGKIPLLTYIDEAIAHRTQADRESVAAHPSHKENPAKDPSKMGKSDVPDHESAQTTRSRRSSATRQTPNHLFSHQAGAAA